MNEDDLAASGLVLSFVRTARIVTFIGDMMLERLDGMDHPGESGEETVLKQLIELTVPGLRPVGEAACWQAADLIDLICNQIVLDFQLTLQGDERRN